MFHDLPSANERTGEASGIIQSRSKGLRTRVSSALNSSTRPGLRTRSADVQGRRTWMSQLQQRKQIDPLFFWSYLDLQWTSGCPSTLGR